MKKALYLTALLAAALVSCSKAGEDITTPENTLPEETVTAPTHPVITLSATLPATKAVFTEEEGTLKVAWAEDDKILIINKTGGKVGGILTAVHVDGGNADFTGELDAEEGDVLSAYFGKGVTDGDPAYSTDGVHFDLSSQGGDLAYCQYHAPMYATVTYSETEANTLAFTNLASIVKARVKVPAALDVAYLELSSDKNLLCHSGTVSLDGEWTFGENDFGPIAAAHAESLSADASTPAYLIVPAQTLGDYLTVSAFDKNYGTFSTAASPETESEKGYFAPVKSASTTFEASRLQTLNKVLTGYVGSAANIDYTHCSLWKIHGEGVTYTATPNVFSDNTLYSALQATEKEVSVILTDEKSLPAASFYRCGQLASIQADQVTEIGEWALASTGLTTFAFPKVKDVGAFAFAKSPITEITEESLPLVTAFSIRDALTLSSSDLQAEEKASIIAKAESEGAQGSEMGTYVFYACEKLKKADMPLLGAIPQGTFYCCELLEEVSFPAAESIGKSAFSKCPALSSLSFPVATTIGESAFTLESSATTAALQEISESTFPAVRTIKQSAFEYRVGLTSVVFPSATLMESQAFRSCKDLQSASFPALVTIGSVTSSGGAFSSCPSLTEISLPNATTIGGRTFMSCKALTSLDLPKATAFGGAAFANCTSLTTLTIGGIIETWTTESRNLYCTSGGRSSYIDLHLNKEQASVSLPALDIATSSFGGETFKSITLDQ